MEFQHNYNPDRTYTLADPHRCLRKIESEFDVHIKSPFRTIFTVTKPRPAILARCYIMTDLLVIVEKDTTNILHIVPIANIDTSQFHSDREKHDVIDHVTATETDPVKTREYSGIWRFTPSFLRVSEEDTDNSDDDATPSHTTKSFFITDGINSFEVSPQDPQIWYSPPSPPHTHTVTLAC